MLQTEIFSQIKKKIFKVQTEKKKIKYGGSKYQIYIFNKIFERSFKVKCLSVPPYMDNFPHQSNIHTQFIHSLKITVSQIKLSQ